jgi:hypothetical protein
MNLTSTDTNPVRLGNRFGWAFPMRTHDGKDYRVVVTDDALLAIAAPCVSGIPQLSGEYRSKIEEIASAKHSGGLKEEDGCVLITQADVEGANNAEHMHF